MIVDLREPLQKETAAWLSRNFASEFAIITAHNPGARMAADDENTRRAAHLDERVAALQVTACRADGRSPHGAHRERGWAIALPLEYAREVGREFEQAAIFWFDGDAFWLMPLDTEARPERLPAEGKR